MNLLTLNAIHSLDFVDGDVRLVDGGDSCAGRLEYYDDGEWGTICHDSWELKPADLVCKQLNCGRAVSAPTNAYFGQGSGRIWANGVVCTKDHSYLKDCFAWWFIGKENATCGHEIDAGVICSDHGKVRLVDGESRCSGRVEVYYRGEWGTLCDDGWGISAANVVCRQLGCGHAVWAPGEAHFGNGTGPIWLDNIHCSGTESYLWQCGANSLGEHDCKHDQDVGVTCSEEREPIKLRLVNGDNPCSGTLQVFYKGQWGTICGDGWDTNNAEVVCRQLDCGSAVSAPLTAHFGSGTGPVWVDVIDCKGDEASLLQCQSKPWGHGRCDHSKDAGVVCSEKMPLRLVDGDKPCSGRVEILHNGRWGSVCDGLWDLQDADVVCKELGCGIAISAPGRAHFGEGSGEIWKDDVECDGSESRLVECPSRPWGQHNCTHRDDAGVVCSDAVKQQLQLINGESLCSGRLEVYHNGSWGRVFDDFWDLSDGQVACRQLGCGNVIAVYTGSRYGKGKGPVWLNRVECQDSMDEDLLWNCTSSKLNQPQNLRKDAALTCSGYIPYFLNLLSVCWIHLINPHHKSENFY
nr:PREDICTED: deleted in malignant brain tumors 1 protein-like [Latimeria chalumnae]|eukprot:XP_014353051.1 PREDICTED: deleted in malignant brain tumors 1 protein-like [Latimeria chalumnae]